ncbi:LutC/YkgG family protein [Streptomyces flaveolus]|uniref:LutC/YkgG family protein n=1 Tax=Streptomyces flaveolus TaxID=67297 RepID=UPI00369D106A
MTPPSSSRDRVLGRVRRALADAPEALEVSRDYLVSHTPDDPATVLDLLHENLADYRAGVHRSTRQGLAALIGELLAGHGARSVVVPPGLPGDWLTGSDARQRFDDVPLTPEELDSVDAVVTGCALAVAETGTVVLDAGPGQGRRALTLVSDVHICVVDARTQVVASLPQAVPRLDPTRPSTWISGPSATSDIELDRVEGVHGPRTLEVVLVVD